MHQFPEILINFSKYKTIAIQMPLQIIEYDKQHKIINEKYTSELVKFRQQHPVLHKINIDSTRSQIYALFNTLIEGNVERVCDEVLKVDKITEQTNIELLSDIIINCIMKEKYFIKQYAEMCYYLKVKKGNQLIMPITITCRNIYDKIIVIESDNEKTEIINFITFLGHLYQYDIIDNNSVDYCFNKALTTDELLIKNKFIIEMLYCLLKIIHNKYSLSCSETYTYLQRHLNELKSKDNIGKRNKFMIEDMLEIIQKQH